MDALRILTLFALTSLLSGCQLGYYFQSAKNHLTMMSHRVPIEKAAQDESLPVENRAKLKVAMEAHHFAIEKIGLKETENYTTYIQLDRPAVSWVVSAAPRWKLEHKEWSYPFVGKMPYKGYASEDDAKEEQQELEKDDLDTYMRGVTAYSTLGWFKDSVLSTMLQGPEHQLVNTIIHETTHTTLYIRNSADFNERLAVFIGNKGCEQFYIAKEGPNSPTVKTINAENDDDKVFSGFIGPELAELKKWYENLPADQKKEELRQARFKEIQKRFVEQTLPKMKTKSYARFPQISLNNARLLYYRLYMQNLADFEELYSLSGENWTQFIACAQTLEKTEKPDESLKELNSKLRSGKAAIAAICRAK